MRSSLASDPLPDIADVEAAARRLEHVAVVTPLLESPPLNDRLGCRLLVKAEMLQRTGSFKFRGAFNALSQLTEAERRAGILAYSSGNHAQGVAAAARLLGIHATIVMPSDAPAPKLEGTRAWGAEVVVYDRATESREEIAGRLAAERGAPVIRPYEEPRVIAGQGTVGLEIADQAAAFGTRVDSVLVPCGGGGLSAGIALALAARSPGTAVHAVEPEAYDDTARSLAAGHRVRNEAGGRSLCDALLAPEPGANTFAINVRLLAGGFAVSDAEALTAMATAWREFKLVAEPGGAVALATALSGALDARGKTVCAVLSGGNVAWDVFAMAFADRGHA